MRKFALIAAVALTATLALSACGKHGDDQQDDQRDEQDRALLRLAGCIHGMRFLRVIEPWAIW